MFGSDISLFVTKYEKVRPTGRGTSVVARVILRARGTENGGQIKSFGYYHGGVWIPSKGFRSDMAVLPSGEVVPMWKTNLTTSNMVQIPAVIRRNSNDGSIFAKLDQSSYETKEGVTEYHYRHLIMDRNGSLENIAIESMLAALYNILEGEFETYNPRGYHGNVTCAHCKSHIYVNPREVDEWEAPLLPTKSVTDLREIGPAGALHYCTAKQEWIDDDCANRFNIAFKLSPQFYTNEWGQTLTLGSTKMLTYKPGLMRIRLATHMEDPIDEDIDPTIEAADDGEDAYDEENSDADSRKRTNSMYGNMGTSYLIEDAETEKANKISEEQLDKELAQLIEEGTHVEELARTEGPKKLWCTIKGCHSMFEQPNLTNEITEVVAKAYAVDYNDYVAAELYSIAGECPHYCSSYKKGAKWVNVIYPNRALVSRGRTELNDKQINSLASSGKSFRIKLSKSELIYALKG